jgi:hypothetical protein
MDKDSCDDTKTWEDRDTNMSITGKIKTKTCSKKNWLGKCKQVDCVYEPVMVDEPDKEYYYY